MPDLPQHLSLTSTQGASLTEITQGSNSNIQQLVRVWAVMIHTLNALSQVDLAANRPPTPELDHIFFTESDGSQLTYVAVNGVWRALTGTGGGGSSAPLQGLDGEPGEDGLPGPPGLTGSPGAPGTTGAPGPIGPATFLEAEVLEGEMGPPGPLGAIGATGPPGATGIQGPIGPAVFLEAEGTEGDAGPPGSSGVQGIQGIAGTTGAQGPLGPAVFLDAEPGEDGLNGPPGATGPQGPPGGGGGSWSTIEQNLGGVGTESWRGRFTLVDAAISPTSKVVISQASGPYTGKGTRADEAEMDPLWCVAEPGSGQAIVYWRTMAGVSTTFSEIRGTQPVGAVNTQHGDPFRASLIQRTLGLVRGNVKFTYQVGA